MTTDVHDLDLLRASCERARDFGATGTFIIHPSHIPVVHDVFSPTEAEIKAARDVLHAMADAIARGDAAVRLGNEMVDYAHARTSLDLLRDAEALGLAVGDYPDLDIPSY
jgi:citrate lyase subunit beta/citryl-CoA lyase